ncbi:hypothetical protein [Comamonas odontotermitis]|uniref:hypothetical protein n=1 Tax=Comamonas odontotermitis TaxID=379895 RepID=UPI003751FB48
MAKDDFATDSIYQTPPGGDFVRYVERLLARQSLGHAHQTTSQMVVAPASTSAKAPRRQAKASVSAASSAAHKTSVSNAADALLERIRQLESRRQGGSAQADRAGDVFSPAAPAATGKLADGQQINIFKLIGWVVMAVIGVAFPPLGLVMLVGVIKKAMDNAKK